MDLVIRTENMRQDKPDDVKGDVAFRFYEKPRKLSKKLKPVKLDK